MSKLLAKTDKLKSNVDEANEAFDDLTKEFQNFGINEKDLPMMKIVRTKLLRVNALVNGLLEHINGI